MAGIKNSTLCGNNADFSQFNGPTSTSGPSNGLITNGQLWIGSTALNVGQTHINVGTLTSPLGTLTIGYSSPNITIDLTGGAIAIQEITVDTTTGGGTNPVVPTGGLITVTGGQYASGTFGTRVVDINSSAASTLQVLVQQTSAVSATNSTKNGVAHFNNAEFTVDSNGFVSLKSGGFVWNDVTTATQTIAVQNGYVTDRGGGVTYTLPATAAFGDEFIITGKSGQWTLSQNANQQISIGSGSTTVGVAGSLASTNAGDSVSAVCTTAGASTIWRIFNFVGNITVT
jgi:hypothetical protein